jgi:3-deoxy-manno-octulosonate cytidylyltransferase (CMP-KDO synthetase)
MNPLILIPARMAATRLPNKPLADIGGKPMIVRAYESALNSGLPVAVAAGDQAIVDAIADIGGQAVLTDPDLPSGSDRIRAALEAIDPDGEYDAVINLQGDMPFADPGLATACAALLHGEPTCDIATLVAAESDVSDRTNVDVVKAVLALAEGERQGKALYFTRSTLYGDAPVWRHIGVYGYRREALMRFCWNNCGRWRWACPSGPPSSPKRPCRSTIPRIWRRRASWCDAFTSPSPKGDGEDRSRKRSGGGDAIFPVSDFQRPVALS